jgi:hypothetical protein
VLATDARLRFVPVENFNGTPGPLGVHALDDTYVAASPPGRRLSRST